MSINREPIFWASTTKGVNDQDRERWIVNEEGERVRERFPQRGHIGPYDNYSRAPGERWALVVRHDGHEIRMVLTNAAAHVDSSTSWAQQQRGKQRTLGWYNPGQCPCALLMTGAITPDLIVDKSIIGQTPCAPGTFSTTNRCPHSKSEQEARRARNKRKMDERELAQQSKDDKIIEVMREQIESNRLTTEALAAAVTRPAVKREPKSE